ncbi:MAG: hypothetical protein LBM93_06585 [Oscillospiraceae bacterium]|jgi:hypothetical protein|nr:hypothetical protein [Oscillospiraceae bacterium]
MKITEGLKEKLEKIKPEKVILYLDEKGWRLVYSLPLVEVFQIEKGKDFFQADVPVGLQVSNFSSAMNFVIEEIAEYENRSFDEVLFGFTGD